jgi:polyisoprenoid-binding protein YceI
MSNDDVAPDAAPEGPRFPRWLKWGLLGALAVVVLGYGAVFLYAKVLNDSPDELDEGDLEEALADDDAATADPPAPTEAPTTDTGAATTAPSSPTTAPAQPTTAPDGTQGGAATGTWVIATDASELGYRVKEILFGVDTEGVGRTNEVDGEITIAGTQVTDGQFVVDVATITSDESRRDNQFRGRIMSTDQFPEATFVLTEPIELGTEPVEGAEVTTTATGDLTLRGVTNPVTFDVQARLENGRIGVLGSIPVVFADYGIANPSTAGITTEDNGLLEFVLVFEPA